MIARLLFGVLVFVAGCQSAPTEFSSLADPGARGPESAGSEPAGAESVAASLPDVPRNPEVADLNPDFRPAPDSIEGGLWMVVEGVERDVNTAGNRIADPQLNDYVTGVACRIAGPYCDDLRVYVLRAPHFNASMYPNGMMHVWSGLLLRAENEAQLAAVIGHEMGHYARRHGLQRFKDRKNKQDFLAFLQLGLAAGGVSEFGDIAYYATLGSMYSFSRDNEREADAIGVRWMASAGYDPLEAPRVWQNVIRETELAGGDASRSFFFSTHPPPSERTETLSAFAQYMHDTEELRGETGRDRYARIVGPWRRLFLEDEVQTKSPRDALALISTLKEGNMSAGDLLFYEGEVYRLRDDEGDLERALSLYQEALEHRTPPASIHRSLGLVLMKLGRQSAAKAHFKRYLIEHPDAQDSKMIEFTLQQLES